MKKDNISIGMCITIVSIIVVLLTTVGGATYFLGSMNNQVTVNTETLNKMDIKMDKKFTKVEEGIDNIDSAIQGIELRLGIKAEKKKEVPRCKPGKKSYLTYYIGD